MKTEKEFSTVYLDPEKCKGCVACMKRCPTDAIRVRNGVASVDYSRCIGCGECVRICPHGAKLAAYDSFDVINQFKHRVALVPPSFYAQFDDADIDSIVSALLKIGFTDVIEVGVSAELVTDATLKIMHNSELIRPIISTACPAVVELIYNKFSSLIPNLLNVLTPVDVTAKFACEKYEQICNSEEVGVFFISPCPAKVYALKSGMCVDTMRVDGVLAVSDVYRRVLPNITTPEVALLNKSTIGLSGLEWAISGGEANGIKGKCVSADGIENVVNILNAIEDGKFDRCDFIELNACPGGCVGGVLNVENPFIAKSRLKEIGRKLQQKVNYFEKAGKSIEWYKWETTPNAVIKQIDRQKAMSQLVEYDSILKSLPSINCGLCGAPSCSEFAYDISSGLIPRDSKCPVKNENT